jgi:hypothetical protein
MKVKAVKQRIIALRSNHGTPPPPPPVAIINSSGNTDGGTGSTDGGSGASDSSGACASIDGSGVGGRSLSSIPSLPSRPYLLPPSSSSSSPSSSPSRETSASASTPLLDRISAVTGTPTSSIVKNSSSRSGAATAGGGEAETHASRLLRARQAELADMRKELEEEQEATRQAQVPV